MLGDVNNLSFFKRIVDNAQLCFAFTPQANFSTHNLNFYQMKAMESDPEYFLKSFILWRLFTGISQQLNLLVLFAAYSTHSGFVAQFKRGQILELLFEILWFLPINPFTLPIFDPSPQKNWDVIYGPLLGLILTWAWYLHTWMYYVYECILEPFQNWSSYWAIMIVDFLKSQKVSIRNGYEENTSKLKFLSYLKLKSETSILLLL